MTKSVDPSWQKPKENALYCKMQITNNPHMLHCLRKGDPEGAIRPKLCITLILLALIS